MTKPRLHIFLGAGGVGKTTLSAAFAVSLANSGRHVGLLSIDPARRLQQALGVQHLSDEGVLIPTHSGKGELRACVLQAEQSLTRWVEEKGMDAESIEKLFANPYFHALSEKMASATDVLAAVRIAEWAEQHSHMTDLVIDTAPGIHAVDFIVKPEKMMLFLDSKLAEWLKLLVVDSRKKKQNIFARVLKTGAQKILEGLSFVGGKHFLINFGEFLILLDEILLTAVNRLKVTHQWFFHSSTRFVLVTSVRSSTALVAKEFARILKSKNIVPSLCVVNRALNSSVAEPQKSALNAEKIFLTYLANYQESQNSTCQILKACAQKVVTLPVFSHLDSQTQLRMQDLCLLGDHLRHNAGDILP